MVVVLEFDKEFDQESYTVLSQVLAAGMEFAQESETVSLQEL